jgi:Rab GDP dissociation inhibitor
MSTQHIRAAALLPSAQAAPYIALLTASPCSQHFALQLWEKFRPGQAVPKELGSSRDYNVDMVPKFMMANGKLVRVLIYTDVTKYLEFKAVDGSFVLNKGRVYKVPATDMEALRSPLMGLFEKRRARNFFM